MKNIYKLASLITLFLSEQLMALETPFGEIEEYFDNSLDYDYRYQIHLDGKAIFKQQFGVVHLKQVKSFEGVTYAVISGGEGVHACLELYRVIEIRSKDNVKVSEEFGSCAEDAEISIYRDKVTIVMPEFIPHPELLSETELKSRQSIIYTYEYVKGNIREIKMDHSEAKKQS